MLVLHGFTGNPDSMRPIAEWRADQGYSVELPRLPGHGTTVEDLRPPRWTDWTKTAEAAFDALSARCARVALVGLSMGGGLAAHVAEERPARCRLRAHQPACQAASPRSSPTARRQLLEAGVEIDRCRSVPT